MGKQYRVVRKVATVPINPGGFTTIDLPRNYDLESVFMRIAGTVNITTAATSVRIEAPCQAVSRVELIADGKNTIASLPFWALSLGRFDRALTESGARATTPPTTATIASYAVEAIGCLDQMMVDGLRPKDTNFRTSGLQLFQLRLSFGQTIDMFVPGAGVATYTNMNIEIWTQELVELPDAQGNYTSPIGLRKVSYQEIALAASNVNQEVRLPAGNLIKSVFMRTEGVTTAGEPGVGTLNNVQLVSGVDVRVNVTAPQLRAKNNADSGQLTAGYYYADMTYQGASPSNLTEMWDVSNQAEPKLVLDVTGGANIKMQVVTTEIILATNK